MLIECLTVFATTFLHEAVEMEIPRGLWNFKFYSSIHLYLLMKINGTYSLFQGVVNGCCTVPVNVIKFKINYSPFFRDVEKTEYVLNVCQFMGFDVYIMFHETKVDKILNVIHISHSFHLQFTTTKIRPFCSCILVK